MESVQQNNISKNSLNRSSIYRRDKKWIIDKLHDEKSRIIPVFNSTLLLDGNDKEPKAIFLTHKDLDNSLDLAESSVFLGVYNEIPYFAINIKSDEIASSLSQKTNGSFQSIRWSLSLLNHRDCELLTLASFMIYWHLRNQYCGKCGKKTKSKDAGHVRICINEDCKESFFPSMDPAVIVLVSSGDRCLLGRQKWWPKDMYSTLAGFVEPGETIEEAVVREIQEEVGVNVEKVQYQHSQSWLFPSSLMLGFTALAKGEAISLNSDELEDARWFTKEEIKQKPQMLPNKVSISHKLIMEWVEKDDKRGR